MLNGTSPSAEKDGGYTGQWTPCIYWRVWAAELLTYGHVIGGVDADGGHVGARAGADVGDTSLQHLPGTTQLCGQSCYTL